MNYAKKHVRLLVAKSASFLCESYYISLIYLCCDERIFSKGSFFMEVRYEINDCGHFGPMEDDVF